MRAAERAYTAIREGILLGRHAGGVRLIETELALAIGVSRTPVREALRRLHAEGLVHFLPNHGAVVALFEARDAEEIFELRAMLEPISARLAAERASPEAIAELRALAEVQVRESKRRRTGFLARIGDLNDRFHRAIQAAADSPRLAKMLAGGEDPRFIARRLVILASEDIGEADPLALVVADAAARAVEQHLELVQALEARDPIWAHGIMQAHILAGRATYIRSRGLQQD